MAPRTPEQIAAQALKDYAALQLKIAAQKDLDIIAAEKLAEQQDRVTAGLENELSLREKALLSAETASDEAAKRLQVAQDTAETLQHHIDLLLVAEESVGRLEPAEVTRMLQLQTALAAQEALVGTIKAENTARAQTLKLADDANIRFEGMKDSIDLGLKATIGFNSKWKENTFIGKMYAAKQAGTDYSTQLSEMGEALQEVATGEAMMGTMITHVVEQTFQMNMQIDQSTAEFNQATGAAGEFDDVLIEVAGDAYQFGLAMKEAMEAVAGLHEHMTAWSGLIDSAKGEASLLGGALTKIGVNAGDAAEVLETGMRGFGKSFGDSKQMVLDLHALSKKIKVPIGQVFADFNLAMKELGKYGPDGVKIFHQLAAQAKATGVEMETLLGIAGKFDTLEGAAEAASQLNAIFGTMINPMEMLGKNEAERILLIKQRIAAEGKAWKSMDNLERQAVGVALGISDMNELNKAFGSSLSVYEDATKSVNGVSGSMDELQDDMSASLSLTEKFNILLEKFAVILDPIILLLHGILNVFLGGVALIDNFGKGVENLTGNFLYLGDIIQWLSGPAGIWLVYKAFAALFGLLTGATTVTTIFTSITGAITSAWGFLTGLFASGGVISTFFTSVGGLLTALATMLGVTVGVLLGWIAAIVAVIALIVVFWDDIMDFFANLFSDFGDWLTGMFSDFGHFLTGLLDIAFFPIFLLWNIIAGVLNGLIALINKIPGVDIAWRVPYMPSITSMIYGHQEGIDNRAADGRPFIAGEGGPAAKPEMIVSGPGPTNVISNERISSIMTLAQTNARAAPLEGMSAYTNAVEKNTEAIEQLANSQNERGDRTPQGAQGGDTDRTIVVQVGQDELARVVTKALNHQNWELA